jgi:hypothetical protein
MSSRICSNPNCGDPCPYDKPVSYHVKTGLCHTCHQYQIRYGHPRSKRLVELARERRARRQQLCECGQPAVAVIPVEIGDLHAMHGRTTTYNMPLCADCLALESEDPVEDPAPDFQVPIFVPVWEYQVRVR